MIVLKIRFTAGRYHATPWSRHVNEGAVEWPPSPWRILRALIAVWHRKFSNEISGPLVRGVIEQLTEPPLFHLPKAALGHTRHFMPQKDPLGKDKTKVFDAFVSVSPDDPLTAVWLDVELSEENRLLLARLVSGLGYLGRAESWVNMEISDQWDGIYNCEPIKDGDNVEGELVRALAALNPEMYMEWMNRSVAQVAGQASSRIKGRGKIKTGTPPIPPDLWTALHAETSDLQKQGWSSAPGSRWVDYARPGDSFQVTYKRRARIEKMLPTVARFVLSSAVLPRLTDTLFIGERMRQALMARSRGLDGSEHALPVFSGKALDGSALTGDHVHAFYLPADDNGDGKLDHITIYASKGFDLTAQIALNSVRKLWGSGGHDIDTVLVGLGDAEGYGGFDLRDGQTPQLASSRIWMSRTPYLLTRHPKKNGKDSPEAQLRVELARRRFPDPTKVDPLDHTMSSGKKIRWLEFRRIRKGGGGRLANPSGYGFRIEFPQEVSGPMALGYSCHFGLGQFIPVEE